MATTDPLAFSQKDFIAASQLHVTTNDAGFVWGATVTDLCRTMRHRLYRWPDHLARFRQSCRVVGINVRLSDERITEAAEHLASHNNGLLGPEQDLVLVTFATPGLIGYYTGQENDGPTFAMHTFPAPFARYRRLFTEGARLVVPPTRQAPEECVDPRVKQRSRMHWWLAEQEAHQIDGNASALLLNQADFVTETAAANFLLVRGGAVVSPPAETVLNGVSRQVVKELCVELGIAFREELLSLEDCLKGDEAILTNSVFCLCGVRSLNGQELPWPGPVFERLLTAWNAKLGMDIREQILSNPR